MPIEHNSNNKGAFFAFVTVILVAAGVVTALHMAGRPMPQPEPQTPVSCPALLRDYQRLQRDLDNCRRYSSENYHALEECRSIRTGN